MIRTTVASVVGLVGPKVDSGIGTVVDVEAAVGATAAWIVGEGIVIAPATEPESGWSIEPIAARPKMTAAPATTIRRRVSRRPVVPPVMGPLTAAWPTGTIAVGAPSPAPSVSKSRRQPWQKRNAPRRAVPHCGQNSDTDPPRVTVARARAPDVKYVRMPA